MDERLSNMLNADVQKYIDRLKEIRDQSSSIAALERDHGPYVPRYIAETDQVEAWLMKARNIIDRLFAETSVQHKAFYAVAEGRVEFATHVLRIKGVLDGIIDDVEGGYAEELVMEITIDILSDVLEQAKELLREGLKDAAAIYGRIALEKHLKTIASNHNINPNQRANKVNDELKGAGIYSQVKWRQFQVWLDIGNKSAHGDFSTSVDDINQMLDGIERFIKLGQ